MAAGATYNSIATTTVSGSTTTTVSFASISGAYTDLILVYNGQTTLSSDQNLNLQFNSDTGTNYSYTRLLGNGTAASSGRGTSQTSMQLSLTTSDNICSSIIHIQNYANTTTNKTAIARANTTNLVEIGIGLWRSSTAITSITLRADASDVNNKFAIGSVFTLYGIAAA